MFFVSLISLINCGEWKIEQILLPDIDNFGIFGRAVSISSPETNKIAVSASWETVNDQYKLGCIYVFEFSADENKYIQKHKLIPQNTNPRVLLNNTGSTCKISSDGTRIVAGAPYSTVDNSPEVGALVVWDYNDNTNQYEQTYIIAPNQSDVEAYQGFGRSLTITSDGKTIASSYYNKPNFTPFKSLQGKVFITKQNIDLSWTIPIKLEPKPEYSGKYLKFGSDLEFIDASRLLVATTLFDGFWEAGTILYQKVNDTEWKIEQEIYPANITNYNIIEYGSPISMPLNSQNILGLGGSFNLSTQTTENKTTGAFFILEKNSLNPNQWNTVPQQTIYYPSGETLSGIDFCSSDIFVTQSKNVPNPRNLSEKTDLLYIYKRNSSQHFIQSDYLQSEINPPNLLNFGSDVQWRSDCKLLVVGAFTKYPYSKQIPPPPNNDMPSNESRVYIYKFIEENDYSDYNQWIYIGISIFVITIFVGLIVFVIISTKNNSKTKNYLAETV